MLEARNLTKNFKAGGLFGSAKVAAVAGVSLRVQPGRTMGVVGESGAGKSTLARMLTLLLKPDSGEVLFQGKSSRKFGAKDWRAFRKNIQIIFQDPVASLNPRMRIGEILSEPFRIHRVRPAGGDKTAAAGLLEKVGLPFDFARRFPHQLSGGERQRVSIARAVALEPRIVVCDEPVSSLDVLVQAQVLNLLLRLQKESGLGYLFISHDLRIVRHMSDDVAVMHDGKIVEEGPASQILASPRDPYTRTLLESLDLTRLRTP